MFFLVKVKKYAFFHYMAVVGNAFNAFDFFFLFRANRKRFPYFGSNLEVGIGSIGEGKTEVFESAKNRKDNKKSCRTYYNTRSSNYGNYINRSAFA